MAKELPYFRFEPAEYLAGDIMTCSYSAQGVFPIIESHYWLKNCSITLAKVKQRLSNAEKEIKELIENGIIKIENDNIKILFLDEQFSFLTELKQKRSYAGKLGGQAKQAKVKQKGSKGIAKAIYKKRIEENISTISFDVFWDLYDKKVGKDKSEEKWNKLSDDDRIKIMQHIPKYKIAQPDKKFRKDPETYFNNKSWNDEIILNTEQQKTFQEENKKDDPWDYDTIEKILSPETSEQDRKKYFIDHPGHTFIAYSYKQGNLIKK